MRKPAENNNA